MLLLSILLYSGLGISAQSQIAIAANFVQTAHVLKAKFESQSEHTVILIPGSSGKHFAQIVNGAPFDALLSADSKRPQRLEQARLAVSGSRFTYAIGRLVLWSPQNGFIDKRGDVLNSSVFQHLAMANPKLAPYGQAAREVMQALGVWEQLQQKLVYGENIGQTYQFVYSGQAKLGFIALSQTHQNPDYGWLVPQHLHQPIAQQAVLLTDNISAAAFLSFMRSKSAREVIKSFGYDLN